MCLTQLNCFIDIPYNILSLWNRKEIVDIYTNNISMDLLLFTNSKFKKFSHARER